MPKTSRKSGQITLAELSNLIEIYHGRQNQDLQAPIPIQSRRIKGNDIVLKQDPNHVLLQMDAPSDPIIALENLIVDCELAGYQPPMIITGKRRDLLIEIIRPYMFGKITPHELLCKRIGTYLQVGIDSSFNYASDETQAILFFCMIALVYRPDLDSNEDNYSALMVSVLVKTIICFLQTFGRKFFAVQLGQQYIKKYTYPNDEYLLKLQREFQMQCDDFSKTIGLRNAPHFFIDDNNKSAASSFIYPFKEAPGGYIRMSKNCIGRLDIEEVHAVLAHEIGHIVNQKENYSEHIASFGDLSSIIASLSSKFLFQLLNYLCSSNNENLFGNKCEILFMIACVSLICKTMNHAHEFKADETAAKLTGALSISSALRTLSATRENTNRFFKPMQPLLKLVNDVFSSHPNPEKRVKKLMLSRP